MESVGKFSRKMVAQFEKKSTEKKFTTLLHSTNIIKLNEQKIQQKFDTKPF